ncbi:hypothetical protein [Enterococcus sp. DIV1059_2]|uniref:hypothetical protein n=1 Tax=Enterococcus sp. DIV1059_2 TaxID=2774664 RepID=UPI003F28FE7B
MLKLKSLFKKYLAVTLVLVVVATSGIFLLQNYHAALAETARAETKLEVASKAIVLKDSEITAINKKIDYLSKQIDEKDSSIKKIENQKKQIEDSNKKIESTLQTIEEQLANTKELLSQKDSEITELKK